MHQESNQMSGVYSQRQPSNQAGSGNNQCRTTLMNLDQQTKHSAELDLKPYVSVAESQQRKAGVPHAPSESDHERKEEQSAIKFSHSSGMQNLDNGHNQIQDPGALQLPSRESQLTNMQSQSASAPEQANRLKQMSLGSLIPIILPELDKDRAMQLQMIHNKLKKNEISKDGFVRLMIRIVGEQMLKVAIVKMQSKMARESHSGPNKSQLQAQNSMQPHKYRVPGMSAKDPYEFAHLRQRGQGWQTSSDGEQKFGATSSMSYIKQEPVDSTNEQQSRPAVISAHGTSFGQQFEQGSTTTTILNDKALERKCSRTAFTPTTTVPHNSMSSSMAGPTNTDFQAGPSTSSTSPAVISASNTKAAQRKSSSGRKKPLNVIGSSPPLTSKKQKLSGAFSDQSIEHLNDVTAVSGVNLREEEEQLFSGSKDDTGALEASRRVVQEEEDRLLLQKLPLQKKLAEIMTKCGLKNLSNDVERCLSLCVEERLRGVLRSMIRISRLRVDYEKSRYCTVVTSDVRQQILEINRKAREEWDKEQAAADKLRRLNEPDDDMGLDGDKEKDENRAKLLKVNKEDDDKMRATSANVAARAAVGGDDMLSKWQLMAEQARQKREGGEDASPCPHPGKQLKRKNSSTSRNQGTGKKDSSVTSGGALRGGGCRKQSSNRQLEATPNISVKDVIAALEREPHTTKSTLLYRLYEMSKADASSD